MFFSTHIDILYNTLEGFRRVWLNAIIIISHHKQIKIKEVLFVLFIWLNKRNKDKNVHRFALCKIRERERVLG